MEFQSIFRRENVANLWSVCYPEDSLNGQNRDIFTIKFALWSNTHYLQTFFVQNQADLYNPFWNGISIDDAIDQVLDEREHFENELNGIECDLPEYENVTLKDVFLPLHTNIYSLSFDKESHRKAKPSMRNPMIRIYAIELEDGTYVVTGGELKLTETMERTLFDKEFIKLDRVQAFLKQEGITSREGLFY